MNIVEKTVLWILVIGLMVWGGMTLLKKGNTNVAQTNESIRLGFITPLSGDASVLGEFMKNVSDLTVAEINKTGGVNGQLISLVYEDDKCDPKLSVSAAQKLINVDKVKIIIGSTCSGGVLSMLPITSQNQIFVFSSSATSPAITGKSLLFARTVPSDFSQGQVLAEAAISRGWRKIAVVQELTDNAIGVFNAFQTNYPSDKGAIVREQYPSSITDFRSILAKVRAASPDAILLIPQTPITSQMLITNLSEMKWNIPIIATDMISGNADLILANKTFLEGAIVAEQGSDLTNMKYQTLEKNYQQTYGKEMIYKSYAQAEYDSLYILLEGLKQFGNDPIKIAAWVRTIKDWDGSSGKLTIDLNGDRVGGYILKTIKDGKTVELK